MIMQSRLNFDYSKRKAKLMSFKSVAPNQFNRYLNEKVKRICDSIILKLTQFI